MLEIKTLKDVSLNEIQEAFTLSFSKYYFPIHLSIEQLETKLLSENGRLDLSVGAYENDKLVGFMLHCYNIENGSKTIYNGGTGVIPRMQGKQIALKMYDYILPILRREEIDHLTLEVLTENEPAIKLYKSVGFKTGKILDCYNGKLTASKSNTNYEVRELKKYDWDKLQTFWDCKPTWQNSILTMNNLRRNSISLGIYIEDNIHGYIIFNPKEKKINQIAIDKNQRRKGLGNQLLSEIGKMYQESISVINMDSKTPYMNLFLEKRGMKKFTQQFEMNLNIKK